jgi:CRISPR-associated exonuclease Cas4
MAPLFFILLALGLVLLRLAMRGRARSGLPRGRVVYADTGGWDRPDGPLFSRELLLTGKPDYLVADGAALIPVEVKSGRAPTQPYASHVLQLAAYFLLVEECYGQRPPHGIVKYTNLVFEVDNTPELEQEVLDTIENIRADLAAGNAPRDHDDPRRCRACGQRRNCSQCLPS